MSRSLALAAVLGGLISFSAWGQSQSDGLIWLSRVVAAAQTLDYSGVFVYQSGMHSETSRIIHVMDDGQARERLEVLDGSPREVIRTNDEVVCYLPQDKVIISDRRGRRKSFPALLPDRLSGITEYYDVQKGGVGRVAGLDAQFVVLEPRDAYRYGHQLWAETQSGLLLKARSVNEHGETVEQFAFTQIQIGGTIDKASLVSRYAGKAGEWRTHNARVTEVRPEDIAWQFHNSIPGFVITAGMRRQLSSDRAEGWQVVFSDGLAAVSLFIEPLDANSKPETGTFRHGAINIYKRTVGNYLVTALGEVPAITVQRLAEGVEPRR